MAEAQISTSYDDLQQSAAVERGWTTTIASWTAPNTLHFGEALERGLNRFWYAEVVSSEYRRKAGQALEDVKPEQQVDHYEWSFLRKSDTSTLALADGDFNYTMPDDFSGVIVDGSLTWNTAGEEKKPLDQIDPGAMASMRAAENSSGSPLYFCLRPVAFVTATGTRWEMEVYPTPDSAVDTKVLRFDYQAVPAVPSATGEFPLGGALHGQTIRAAVLAELEKIIDDDPQGVHEVAFQRLLQSSIRIDRQVKIGMGGTRVAYPVANLPDARLGVDFFELQREVGVVLGYKVNPFLWGHAEVEKVRQVIRRGYRLYLYPDAVDAQNKGHEWTWMKPTMTFTTAANERYYLLPDDFDRVIGEIHYTPTSQSNYAAIRWMTRDRIQELNSQAEFTSHPSFFSTRPVASDGQSWQRQELILEPTPNGAWELTYEYVADQRELSTTHPYPIGGTGQAELLLTSCLAIAELEKTRRLGPLHTRYKQLLVPAIARDLQRAAKFLGYNGTGRGRHSGRGSARRAGAVGYGTTTYNGVTSS